VPATSPERRHTSQGRERKQQLIDAAVTLFSERGYSATRIADICDQAGVAKGLYYWYFPTKHDLFVELVRTMRRRLRQAQAAGMDPTADPLTRMRQGAEASVRFIAENASYFSFVEVERSETEMSGLLREGSDVYLRDVLALVDEAQRDGLVPDSDPTLVALGVVGAVSSFTNAWRNGRTTVTADELAAFVGDWVANAVAGGIGNGHAATGHAVGGATDRIDDQRSSGSSSG
jgi:AcrR family transcriptional regulator